MRKAVIGALLIGLLFGPATCLAGLGQFAAEHAAVEGWLPGVSSPDQLQDPETRAPNARIYRRL